MKWKANFTDNENRDYVIESTELRNIATGERNTEYYLYIGKDGRYTHDYLQETFEKTKAFAQKKFGVSVDSWIETEAGGVEI